MQIPIFVNQIKRKSKLKRKSGPRRKSPALAKILAAGENLGHLRKSRPLAKISAIGGLRDQVDAVVEAEVRAAAVTMGRRRTLVVRVDDGTGLLTLRFFHFRQAQVSQFRQGSAIQLFGTPRRVGGQLEMVHPEYRLGDSAQLLEAALTPVYPTVSGLGQSTWRKRSERCGCDPHSTPVSYTHLTLPTKA